MIPVSRGREPKPLDKTLRAVIDYDPSGPTFGGLLGRWSADVFNASGEKVGGCLAGFRQVLELVKAEGVSPLRIRYTDRARPYKPSRR